MIFAIESLSENTALFAEDKTLNSFSEIMAAMTASITSAIFSGLKFSEAEKAFRPWWDQIEDYSVSFLITLVEILILIFTRTRT